MKFFRLFSMLSFSIVAMGASAAITLTTSAPIGSEFKLLVNAKSAIQPIIVDFGDGEESFFTIDPNQVASNRWISGTLKGSTITIDGELTEIDCQEQKLTSASISGMKYLQKVNLANNKIVDFEFVDEAPVTHLDLSHNHIENYVSYNNNLTLDKIGSTLYDLNLSDNDQLRCLHMAALTELVYLSAYDCPLLSSVFICSPEDSQDKLISINLSNCDLAHFYPVSLPALRYLDLAGNSLISGAMDTDPFVLGNYPNLATLNVSNNPAISELDVTDCPLLEQLHASNCSLSAIDLSQNPELFTLSLSNNKISSLDLGNNTQLNNLYVENNPISTLDFEKMLKLEELNISGTNISRAHLHNCYFLKTFEASNTKLEFVDFNAQQPERMRLIDLRNCPGFTPLSMAYTVKTLPVARTTQSTATSLYLSGSHPEIADIAYVTSPDMHWICDSEGDGSADYPVIDATISDATLFTGSKSGSLERLYPYGGMGLDYDLDVHSTDGGDFILAQWEPEYFQTIASIGINLRRGIPIYVYPYPAEGKRFRSVTVNGREIFSNWFMVDADKAVIKVNFEDAENHIVLGTKPGQNLSFMVAKATTTSTLDIDWGTGTRTPLTGITTYNGKNIDVSGTRVEGRAAGTEITLYGNVAALDISCYGDVGEELFGLPNNEFTSVNVSECPTLKLLNLYWNPIKSLDVTANPNLEVLDLSYTAISEIDLSKNPKLYYLSAYANSDPEEEGFSQITSINLSGLTALEQLDLHNQALTELNINAQSKLKYLNINNNYLSALNVYSNPNLVSLRATENKLTSIDLSKNSKLAELYLDGNDLTSIDLSANTALQELSVANNQIKSLDTHMLSDLGKVYINGNGMTAEQLNDLYYLLPERRPRADDDDSMSIKFNLIAIQAADREANDGNGADGSIAVTRKWNPNPNGNNSGSATSYLDILPFEGGTFEVTDADNNIFTSGSKVKKYLQLSVKATAAEGYRYDGYRLNGEDPRTEESLRMPGIYTIFEPIFTAQTSIDEVTADSPVVELTAYTADGKIAAHTAGTPLPSLPRGFYIIKALHADGSTTVKTILL